MRSLLIRHTFLVLIALFALPGCQTTTGYYKGALAEPDTVITLQEAGSVKQHWQDIYVSIDSHFQLRDGELAVEGVFDFSQHPKLMTSRVYDFKLKLFLLDDQNRVLDYFDIYRALGGELNRQDRFSGVFPAPASTVAVSFGYEGFFVDHGESGETAIRLPRRSL